MIIESYVPNEIDENTCKALNWQKPFVLGPVQASSPGIYVLYYTGDCPLYADIRNSDMTIPIYIGYSKNLEKRLWGHIKTLSEVHDFCKDGAAEYDLDPADFWCRAICLPKGDAMKYENIIIEK